MGLWTKMKKLAQEHIEENRKTRIEIESMTDKQLHQEAIRKGGKYAEAYVERKKKAREISERIKGR